MSSLIPLHVISSISMLHSNYRTPRACLDKIMLKSILLFEAILTNIQKIKKLGQSKEVYTKVPETSRDRQHTVSYQEINIKSNEEHPKQVDRTPQANQNRA